MRSVAVLLAVASCAAVVAAGCGGVSLDPVAKAAAATQDEDTMKVEMEFSGKSDGEAVTGTGTGSFDNTSGLSAMTMKFDAGGESVSFESRQQDLVMYIRSPLFEKELPAGKHWLKVDLRQAAKKQGVDLSQLTTQQAGDTLQQLEATSGGVEKVGEEDVAGTQTTHYRAQIDFDKVVEQAKTDEQKQSYRNVAKLMGSKTVPVDVWIDGDDHVRKFKESLSVRDPKSAKPIEMTMQMTFVEFGVPVDVALPPADDVLDASSLGG
jgi:hypothetical protein